MSKKNDLRVGNQPIYPWKKMCAKSTKIIRFFLLDKMDFIKNRMDNGIELEWNVEWILIFIL